MAESDFFDQMGSRFFARLSTPILAKDYESQSQTTAANEIGTRDKITVLLVQDDDLKAFNETLPVSYRFWARRITAIADHEPDAIFLDLIFTRKRNDPSFQELVSAACELQDREKPVPVYIGSLQAFGVETIEELRNAKSPIREAPCFIETAIQKPQDRIDAITWEYPIEQTGQGDNPSLKTAAAKIYGDLYQNQAITPDLPMALIWGASQHPDNSTLTVSGLNGSDRTCKSSSKSMLKTLSEFVMRINHKDMSYEDSTCYYHRVRQMRSLREDENIGGFIKGKVVMVGLDIVGASDVVKAPTFENPIHGVFLHAMALDNFLTYGADFKRHVSPSFFPESKSGTPSQHYFLWITACLIYLSGTVLDVREKARVKACRSKFIEGRKSEPVNNEWLDDLEKVIEQGWFFRWLSRLGILCGVALGIFVLGYYIANMGPMSWAEWVFFPILCSFFEWVPKVHDFIADKLSQLCKP